MMALAARPLPPDPPSQPTLVMTTTLSRRPGEAFNQLPMMVSDSPPWLPGTQAE